jgi:hypothetical protein
MGLDVGGALRSGYDRLRTPAGLQIVALAFVVQLVANVVNDTTAARLSEAGSAGFTVEPGPLVVDLPPGVLGVLSILSIAGSLVVTLVALRTFAADARMSIPAESWGNLLWPAMHLFVGTVVLVVTVAIGLVFLVVPGLFLLVSLILFQVYVAAEDEGFLDAMTGSWALARGNRFDLLLVGVGVALVAIVVGTLFGLLGIALAPASPYLEGVAATAGGSVVSTYALATLVSTYHQMTGDAAGDVEPSSGPEIDTDWHR